MTLFPIIGAFLEATGTVLNKRIIKKQQVNYKQYTIYIFAAIVLVSLPLLFFFWEIKSGAADLNNLMIFGLIVISSTFANLLIFYSLQKEDLAEIEPINLMTPLFTILLVFIFSFFSDFYHNERNYDILILSLIASSALILSHSRKSNIVLNKYDLAAFVGSFLFAFELAISKPILSYYNPITFYFLRCLFIFIISWHFFHKKLSSINNKTKLMIFIVAIIAVIYRIILYYSYTNLGVVHTTTIFILAPVLVYIFAWSFLKEKITKRQIVSSIIIVACVIASIILKGNYFYRWLNLL